MSASDPPDRFRPRRRRPRRWSWGTILFLSLLVLIAARRGCEFLSPPRPLPPETLTEGEYELVRVVDGDTIIVRPADGFSWSEPFEARVRLLGVDTPETVKPRHPVEPWGPEATEFTREFLSDGVLELQFDRRRKDRYERFLAYVFVDGEMLNEALVRAGLARVSHYPGDSPQIERQLETAEEEAKRAGRGVWSE